MVGVEDAVRALLRPSEHVKVVLEALTSASSSSELTPNNANIVEPAVDPRHDVQEKRILAVISHRAHFDEPDEGWYVLLLISVFMGRISSVINFRQRRFPTHPTACRFGIAGLQ